MNNYSTEKCFLISSIFLKNLSEPIEKTKPLILCPAYQEGKKKKRVSRKGEKGQSTRYMSLLRLPDARLLLIARSVAPRCLQSEIAAARA